MKELFIQQIFSPSYKNYKVLILEFKRKLRYSPDFKASILAGDNGALKWLEENWQSTLFTSYEEAVNEYNAALVALKQSDKENPEYNEYCNKAVMKYGPEIFSSMLFEVMGEYPNEY